MKFEVHYMISNDHTDYYVCEASRDEHSNERILVIGCKGTQKKTTPAQWDTKDEAENIITRMNVPGAFLKEV